MQSSTLPPISVIVAVLQSLGGVVGLVLGALHVGNLSPVVNDIIVALSGALVALTQHHVLPAAMQYGAAPRSAKGAA